MDQDVKRALVRYLQAAMDRTGKDATNLARAIGVVPSTLTRHLEADWAGGISGTTLDKIAIISGVPVPPELTYVGKKTLVSPNRRRDHRVIEARGAVYHSDSSDYIPVRSGARGGEEQEMFLADGPVDYVPRPHVLERVKDAYALYMVGDSMSPRYEPGFTLYINPFKPPRNGNGVVIFKRNDSVLVKRFKGMTKTELIVEQLNPLKEIRIPRSDVTHVHLVVHVDEVT